MQPDQNQPQTPTPNQLDPLSQSPPPPEPVQQISPVPTDPQQAVQLDATQLPQQPEIPTQQPFQTNPAPVNQPISPDFTTQQPVPGVAPMPTPDQQPVQPAIQQPLAQTDPTQPGYVPPITPAGPIPIGTNNIGTPLGKSISHGKLSSKIRIAIIVVISLVGFSGLGILMKDTVFSGSKIKVSDLVEEESGGVTFKRPKQWSKTEDKDFNVAYSDGGKKLDDSDQGMAVASDTLGGDYDSLAQSEKDEIFKAYEKQFSDKSALSGDNSCQDISDPQVSKFEQSNYTDAIKIEYSCGKFAGRNVKGVYKLIVGFKGSNLNMVGIGAIDKTWDKSGAALDDILNTFKPTK